MAQEDKKMEKKIVPVPLHAGHNPHEVVLTNKEYRKLFKEILPDWNE
jgi:hypothetical protein